MPVHRRHRVQDAVRADRGRVVVADGYAGLHLGADHHGGDAKRPLARAPDGSREHGDGRRERHAVNRAVLDATFAQLGQEPRLVPLGGRLAVAGEPEPGGDGGAVEDPDGDTGVADVDGEEQKRPRRWRSAGGSGSPGRQPCARTDV